MAFNTKSLTAGLGLTAAQPKPAMNLQSLLGNPALMAGLGLLGASRDTRINPYEAAMGGLMGAQQFQQKQDMLGLQKQRIEAQQQKEANEAAKAQQQAEAQRKLQEMIESGQTPTAMDAYYAGIPADVYKAQYGAQDRKTLKDASGRQRYMDTGEYVFSDVAAAPPDPDKVFTQEKGLRGEFQTLTKDFRQQEEAFGRILSSAQDPSAAGDLALIFNYMKVLDPGSTVREGEFANAENAGGVDKKIRTLFNKLQTGERLTPAMRADFVQRAGKLYEGAKKGFSTRADEYRNLSTQYSVDPSRVVSSNALYGQDDYSQFAVSDKKAINGKNYIQINGEWFEDDGQ